MTMERRALAEPFEVRAESDGTVKITGYAAVFNQRTSVGGQFIEVIEPGAFRSSLERNDDVVLLINHAGLPLARRSAGNLDLSEDHRGLKMDARLDGTDPDVMRLVPKLRGKLMKDMSFAFRAGNGQRWDDSGVTPVRHLTDFAEVRDVSIVTNGEYGGTEVALRSLEESRQGAERELREHNANAARARIAARKAETEQKIRGIK